MTTDRPSSRIDPIRPSPEPTTRTDRPEVPGTSSPQVRPPLVGGNQGLPGTSDRSRAAAVRRTAQQRRIIEPIGEAGPTDGYAMTDPYVRRFWVAALGPGAVADLLRLAAAAQSGRSLRTPTHLPTLVINGLVRRDGDTLVVPDSVPPLPRRLVDRLTPSIRHQFIAARRSQRAV
jgi:hypothetical protein